MKDKKKREILISGYGSDNSSQVSMALYDMTDGLEFNKELWNSSVISPSFLSTYHDICFAVREEDKKGAVLCFKREGDSYLLQDELELNGGALCHITYQPKIRTLYCSFYETGHIAAIKVENYRFTEMLSFFQMKPEVEEELTRAHCSVIEPEGTRVFSTNISLDRIYIYETEEGILRPNRDYPYIQLPKGIGPRHLKFHPIQSYLYLITEYSNEIITFRYDPNLPRLSTVQRISTIPDEFIGTSYGSSLDISKDGRFLYAANRGANTIAVFEINTDGTLVKIQDLDCAGDHPRHIVLSKDDLGLLVANQKSNEVVYFGVDGENGKLLNIVSKVAFYQPSYVEEL
jgi:6-phosphogluconolactonase